ncbi:LURP-one-related/scramblase family protein [Serinibacter salmoneus]|uniref:Uncharacterized protein YxjI n=1 Tax=Serinibacter salmoneus TaxID=556530 RepID=A0A2A9CWR0_9MICO|nr:phospholipid scramblase-related protein [Serinibacter salmoneus]PFG18571.1 uncharacterized protein YxjI [Serinibacter salmoneus]
MGILDHDVLVVDQVTGFMSNNFAVSDMSGRQVGHIHTEGSALGRMFAGSRDFTVVDETGWVLHLHDTMNWWRDRMEIRDGEGIALAEVVKRLAFFRTSCTVTLDGSALDLTGSLRGMDFTLTGPRGTLATISRQWAGISRAFLGRSRYVVSMSPDLSHRERRALLGSVIALDLIRAKENINVG